MYEHNQYCMFKYLYTHLLILLFIYEPINVKGKFVLVSMKQPTGRPDYNWEEFATEESFTKMKDERDSLTMAWRTNLRRTGFNRRSIIRALEYAGAAGIVASNWSRGFGVIKIFSARTKVIPTGEMELED